MKKNFVAICDRSYDEKYRALLSRPFAHRGVHEQFPENSLLAFAEAIKLGYGIELDIHVTTDDKLVVFHDDNLYRMTGKNEYIKFLSFEKLKQIKLNNSNYGIPTLSEVLNLVDGKVPVLIEVKTNNNMKRLIPLLKSELDKYNGSVFIQSFSPFVLKRCYKAMPNILRGQLSSFFAKDKLKFYKKFIIKKMILNKVSHVDFVSYNIENLPNKHVNKQNVPILAWTIKTKEDYLKAKQNANNVIVDNIDALK